MEQLKEIDEIKGKIKEDEDVISVYFAIDGRIIKLAVYVKDDVTVKEARTKGESYLEYFDEDDLTYYSIFKGRIFSAIVQKRLSCEW